MGKTTKIGWTDHTINFWWGCSKVSPECRHCYIGNIMKRAGIKQPFAGPIRTKSWRNAYSFNAQAKRDAVRRRVFTCSMSDFFHVGADAWRPEAWEVIRACESLDWLILTKRPERIRECLPGDWGNGYENVWLGTTCGCRSSIHRVEQLVDIPAAIRFVSAEPLLEAIDLRPYLPRLHWVITGCEQAKKGVRRIMCLDWVRDLDRQCREAGVPHFFKQHYRDERGVPCTDGILDGEKRQEFPHTAMTRVDRDSSLKESAAHSRADNQPCANEVHMKRDYDELPEQDPNNSAQTGDPSTLRSESERERTFIAPSYNAVYFRKLASSIEQMHWAYERTIFEALVLLNKAAHMLREADTELDSDEFRLWLKYSFSEQAGELSMATYLRWMALTDELPKLFEAFLDMKSWDRDRIFRFLHRKDGMNQ